MCLKKKERYKLRHGIYKKEFVIGNIVLLYDIRCNKDMSQKLSFKWQRPYQICNVVKDKGTYMVEELNRLQLANIFVYNKLKKFHSRN